MTTLDKLIQEFCPSGVEYRILSDLFITKNGYTPSKNNIDYWQDGTIPWFRMEDIRENGRILNSALQKVSREAIKGELFPANSIIVTTSATIGEHALLTVESLANQRFTYLILREEYKEIFIIKFLYYYCFKLDQYCLLNLNKGNFASVDMTKFARFKFPVPPLPVQAEIVCILDSFTELTTELTTELAARRKQYEYYRDELLNFGNNVPTIMLDKVGDVTKLAGFEFTSHVKYKDNGNIIALRGLNVKDGKLDLSSVKYIDESNFEKLNRSKLKKGDMLFTYVGTIGQVAVIDEEDRFYLAPNVARIRFDQKIINPEFMRFYFQTSHFYNKQINKFLNSSSMKNLTMENIRKFIVPIPTLDEQNRLVEQLSRFDKLCNDLTEGLPAEIAARQKQYEYYRDKLLTFKELT